MIKRMKRRKKEKEEDKKEHEEDEEDEEGEGGGRGRKRATELISCTIGNNWPPLSQTDSKGHKF